jgi:flagellar hook-associated protein 1 FlgK
MSLDSALLIATSGLRATSRALETVGNNVANADVTGYTRKVVPLSTIVSGDTASGVRVLKQVRVADTALIDRLAEARASAAGARERAERLNEVASLHGALERDGDVASLTGRLRDGFLSLLAAPQEQSRLVAAVETADMLASETRRVAAGFLSQRQDAHDRLVDLARAVNDDLEQLAALDEQIRRNVGLGQTRADLEDARDQVMGSLAESLGLRPLRQADGGVILHGPGGVMISPRSDARLEIETAILGPHSTYDPAGGDVPALVLRGGDPAAGPLDITRRLTEGRAAALIESRDRVLPRMQAELDMFAHALATRFEQQGLRLFTDSAGAVPQNLLAPDPRNIAGFAAQLTANDAVRQQPRLLRDGTHDVLATDPEPRGAPFTVNDPASGGPEGFVGMIGRVLDHAFGAARSPGVAHVPTPQTGLGPDGQIAAGFVFPSRLTDIASSVVVVQSTLRVSADASAATADRLREELGQRVTQQTGVDVDAELAVMLQLQNAYAANARVIAAADEMWRSLLAAV